MDEERRARLLARIGDINDFSRPRPLVGVDEFFVGNDDPGSIGYNLSGDPAPAEFHELFRSISERPQVTDVLIEVKDLEDPDGWPSTDTVWIITTADVTTVRSWFPRRLEPDEWTAEDQIDEGAEPYAMPPGSRAISGFYD